MTVCKCCNKRYVSQVWWSFSAIFCPDIGSQRIPLWWGIFVSLLLQLRLIRLLSFPYSENTLGLACLLFFSLEDQHSSNIVSLYWHIQQSFYIFKLWLHSYEQKWHHLLFTVRVVKRMYVFGIWDTGGVSGEGLFLLLPRCTTWLKENSIWIVYLWRWHSLREER